MVVENVENIVVFSRTILKGPRRKLCKENSIFYYLHCVARELLDFNRNQRTCSFSVIILRWYVRS